MTTITQNFGEPDFASAVSDSLDQIRLNQWYLLIAAVNGSVVAPGWTTTIASASSPVNYGQPDSMTMTYLDTAVSPNVTKTIQIAYTWTDGNVTGMVVSFGDGTSSPELVTVTGGTITLTYDGSGNFTGATTA